MIANGTAHVEGSYCTQSNPKVVFTISVKAHQEVKVGSTIATFTDVDPSHQATLFKAGIDWGDKSRGTNISGATVTGSNGMFTVTNSTAHKYKYNKKTPTYTITVTLSFANGDPLWVDTTGQFHPSQPLTAMAKVNK